MKGSGVCEQTQEWIGPYLEGDVSLEIRQRVERHLLQCAECAWEVQSQRMVRDRLRETREETTASDAFRSRVLMRLRQDNPHLDREDAPNEDPLQYQLPIPL